MFAKTNTRWTLIITMGLPLAAATDSFAQYSMNKYAINSGGGSSSGNAYAIDGSIGQSDASAPLSGGSYSLSGGFWPGMNGMQDTACDSVEDCADLDGNGVRDDACVFWQCISNACVATDIVYADMGGGNGACPVDGAADGNDRFHALNCFSNQSTTGAPGYPCEAESPAAFNVDAAGLGAPCSPDGVCDGNDAFAALNAFGNTTSCTCSSGPAPSMPVDDGKAEAVAVRLIPSVTSAAPGDIISVDIVLAADLQDLRGYQLHSVVRTSARHAGANGDLALIDQFIDGRKNHVFAGLGHWDAFNLPARQLLAGIDSSGVEAARGAYLATLVYKVGDKAEGAYAIDLLHDREDLTHRTVLFSTLEGATIELIDVEQAYVEVGRSKRTGVK